MSNWQSIDLAPRDGRTIRGRAQVESGFQSVFIRWDKGRTTWVHADGGPEYTAYDPLEWMPAPAGLERDVSAFKVRYRSD
jgi:hypothetical protein